MGMAAGQARLLSITARMSDNELRAQIINNQKMRLATESSQVSENYVNALNQAQMMFTNYDADNNTSYQQLTFNALTAYNQYNNQYGLVNASGQILVSEDDAKNFQEADGDMNKFLAAYGLEQTTTYFDELNEYANMEIKDDAGNILWSYHDGQIPVMVVDQNTGNVSYITSGYTAEELEYMFLGGTDKKGNKHSGYETALSSAIYNNYLSASLKFDEEYTDFAETVAASMDAKLEGITGKGKTLNDIYGYLKPKDGGSPDLENDDIFNTNMYALAEIIKKAGEALGKDENGADKWTSSNYFTNLIGTNGDGGLIHDLIQGEYSTTYGDYSGEITEENLDDHFWAIDDNQVVIDDTLCITRTQTGADINGSPIYTYSASIGSVEYRTDDNGTPEDDDDDFQVKNSFKSSNTIIESNGKYQYTEEEAIHTVNFGGSLEDIFNKAMKNAKTDPKTGTFESLNITDTWAMSAEDRVAQAVNIIDNLRQDIYGLWPANDFSYAYQNNVETIAHKDYRIAAANLLQALLGDAYTVSTPPLPDTGNSGCNEAGQVMINDNSKLVPGQWADQIIIKTNDGSDKVNISLNDILAMATDVSILMDYIQNGIPTYDDQGNQNAKRFTFSTEGVQDLVDVIALNNIMNTYGEPKVTWIDTSSPSDSYNENGEAKYEWYSNLWSRMQQGYAVLLDGLASSTEWIQFALESGIVTMEQVDSENNWNGLNYANCSDITEQTNDKAVAIAEAEYNAAMNRIENKDKKYDLELKNIDTEHTSLETEYESIKSAIDKNIERTFKIYS